MRPYLSSVFVGLGFLLLCLLLIAGLGLGFYELGGNIRALPDVETWRGLSLPLWSNLSDAFQAVIGIPVALAGSIVAIVLAYRAYAIAQRQVHYETLRYMENTIQEAAGHFWKIASGLRSLDTAGARLEDALIAHASNEMGKTSNHWDDNKILQDLTVEWDGKRLREKPPVPDDEIRLIERTHARVREARDDFATEMVTLAETLLATLQNPIARKAWALSLDARSDNITPGAVHGISVYEETLKTFFESGTRIQSPGPDVQSGSIVGIAQDLRTLARDHGLFHHFDSLRVSDAIGDLSTMNGKWRWSPADRKWIAKHWVRPQENSNRPTERERKDVAQDAAEWIAACRGGAWAKRRANTIWSRSSLNRFTTLGYLMGWSSVGFKTDDGQRGLHVLFRGQMALETIVMAYPTADIFQQAITESLADRRLHAKDTVTAAKTIAARLGVETYLSDWMIDSAIVLRKKRQTAVKKWPRDADFVPFTNVAGRPEHQRPEIFESERVREDPV